MEDKVIMLEEEQPADSGLKLACDDNDIFDEDDVTDFQLERAINTPTQKDHEVPAQSPEGEEILLPEPMEEGVVESEQDSVNPGRDGQDMD